MKPVIDVKEAAEYLRVSPQTVVRLAKKGEIGRKVGNLWRFPVSGLERYMNGGEPNEQVEAGDSRA
jgi:excisionase family DNA binding protein